MFFLSFFRWVTGNEFENKKVENGQTDKESGKKDLKGLKIRKEILEDIGKSGQKKRQVGRPRKKENG